MKYDRILIRYGELTLKGKNRKFFIRKLRNNLEILLRDFPQAKVESSFDRMYVVLNGEPYLEVENSLKKAFGIQSFSPAMRVEKDMNLIKDAVLDVVRQAFIKDATFKITARRSDKQFEFDTHGLNSELGAHVLRNIEGIRVNVKNPDIEVSVEVRHEAAYVSAEMIQGAGGLPARSSGKGMLMLSGGIDSPVAGYLAMKRGVDIEAVHFHSPPYTNDRAKQKVLDIAEKLAKFTGRIKVHLVPFTKIQEKINEQIPEGYLMTSTRRMMLRIADDIREKNEGLAIINGESLGQVASQTMESMMAINEVTNTPVLRPLIGMDKNEIIDIAKRIETLDISNRPFEDCCTIFTPPAPRTKPKKDKVIALEHKFDWEALIKEAVEETESIVVKGYEKESVLF